MLRAWLTHRQEFRNCVCSSWYSHVALCNDRLYNFVYGAMVNVVQYNVDIIIFSIRFHVIILSYFSHQISIYCWCADKLSVFDLSAGKGSLGCRQHHVTISVLSTVLRIVTVYVSFHISFIMVLNNIKQIMKHCTTSLQYADSLGILVHILSFIACEVHSCCFENTLESIWLVSIMLFTDQS